MPRTAQQLVKQLDLQADPGYAVRVKRFFKTGPGEYAAGDQFIGLRVPIIRSVSRQFYDLSLSEIGKVLASPVHEHRLAALIIMTEQAKQALGKLRQQLYTFYMERTQYVNNWDLVDCSSPEIVGGYLYLHDKTPLYHLAQSEHMWERRIAIVSTWYFIRQGLTKHTFAIAQLLQDDSHNLIHKAVGWMLREAGKRQPLQLLDFLNEHARSMPRVTLRYATERLNHQQKHHYFKALLKSR